MHIGNKADEWIIKRMSPSATEDFNCLYAAVYGRKSLPNYYHHKFGTALAGINYSGFIAYNQDDQPIASLCLTPCHISYGNERIVAAQLTDGMTHPAYRKKGLFSELENHLAQMAKDEGIAVLFGFAVSATNPLLIKKGWYESERLDRFVIPVPHSIKWFLQALRRKTGIRRKTAQHGSQPGCANSVLADGFAGIERNQEYLLYKSFSLTEIIATANAKAWIKTGSQLVIGDMEVKEKDFDKTIIGIQSIAQETGASQIYFQSSKDTSLHTLFSQRYTAIPSFPVVMKKIRQGVDTARIKFTFADIDIF
jgi:GNAT superfamily N-acetyltransferase